MFRFRAHTNYAAERQFKPVFQLAEESGLRVTPHANEDLSIGGCARD